MSVGALSADSGQSFSAEGENSSAAELAGLNFSKELIAFSLYGKIDPKCSKCLC